MTSKLQFEFCLGQQVLHLVTGETGRIERLTPDGAIIVRFNRLGDCDEDLGTYRGEGLRLIFPRGVEHLPD
jgi:hypothetical protein